MTAAKKSKSPNLSWVQSLDNGGGALYQQIAQQIVGAVANGVLQAGDRLPPQRDLAQRLGVDLTTVTRAYAEIRLQGLLDVQGAGGSYIAAPAVASAEAGTTIDLGMNIPPLLTSPAFVRLMQAANTYVQSRAVGDGLMSYHVGAGTKADRDAGVTWLKPVLGKIDMQRLVICAGAQAALAAVLLTQTQAGDTILAEPLTYPGILAAARTLRRSVAPVEADAQGMLPAALAEACMKHRPALIYLTPTIQNPTATTMSQRRREDIYSVASKYRVAIVEDDPYWLLAGDAAPPIATLDKKGSGAPVFYISTLSKCLAPGLRTAYLVVPHSEPVAPLLDALRSILLMPTVWMTAVATYLIRTGGARELLALTRDELALRQQLATKLLPPNSVGHPYGLHRWLPLTNDWDQYRLVQLAQERGLAVTSSDAFSVRDSAPNAVRISLGGAVDRGTLESALRRLAAILTAAAPHRISGVV